MDAEKLGIKIENDRWEVCAHRHTPMGTEPDFSAKNDWKWSNTSLPFDAISWLQTSANGPDPLVARNDLQYQWVEDVDWILRREVVVAPDSVDLDDELHLLVNGIDCYCDVYFNGKKVGQCRNQFREYAFDLDDISTDSPNEVLFYIRSARNVNTVLESVYGTLPASFDTGRVHSRRCQALTGWNMAPRLSSVSVASAPEIRTVSAVELGQPYAFVRQLPGPVQPGQETVESVQVHVQVNLLSRRRGSGDLLVEIVDQETGEVIADKREPISIKPRTTPLTTSLIIPEAKLWWSAAFGKQPLYQVRVRLTAQDRLDVSYTSEVTSRLGIRTVSIDRRKDEEGETFTPVLNGIPVFCRGANWLPVTLLPSTATSEVYRSLVAAALGAGMNCLRVWGGGIYETDEFYDLCDQAGILVWQDFMFASAAYPTYREFLDEVEAEATYQVLRLRDHPCIFAWCGNNENEWLHQVGELRKGNEQRIIGDQIWSHLVREIVEDKDPVRTYVQSSPFGKNRMDYNDMATGDRHSWEVWADWQPISTYLHDTGRFISEFGMQSLPAKSTIRAIAGDADSPDDLRLAHHQYMVEGTERLLRYISAHLQVPADLDNWIESSQHVQGLALAFAIEHWRRRRFHTAGCLVWHLNDPYPAISWSLIDHYQQPKAALLTVAQVFSPVLVSVELLVGDRPVTGIPSDHWPRAEDAPTIDYPIEGGNSIQCEHHTSLVQIRVVIINDTYLSLSGTLNVEFTVGDERLFPPAVSEPSASGTAGTTGEVESVEVTDSEPAQPDPVAPAKVTLEPNESVVALTEVIPSMVMQKLQQVRLRVRWILDQSSQESLATLQSQMASVQEMIASTNDNGHALLVPVNLTSGLSRTVALVEPKYVK